MTTVNHAAQVLQAGEQVVVRPGIYRERTRPACGGRSLEQMIIQSRSASRLNPGGF